MANIRIDWQIIKRHWRWVLGGAIILGVIGYQKIGPAGGCIGAFLGAAVGLIISAGREEDS